MASTVGILRELHRLRQHAKNLQLEIERLPRQWKIQQGKIRWAEETLQQARDELKKQKLTMNQKEGLLKQTHQQLAKHEKQRNEAASKKEYDALQTEISAAQKACQQLEDEILETMAVSEEQAAKVPELEQGVKQARDESARFEQDMATRQNRLNEEMQRAQQMLKETESTLPDDVRPQYDRLITVKGEDALAAVKDRGCTACYTGMTAQNYNDLLSNRLVFCKACGRILYLPEET